MTNPELQVSETTAGLVIRLHVLPRAKRCEIAGTHNGALKVKVTAPPVDDAANRAIIEFLSKEFGVSKSSLQILSGLRSRDKIVQIKGLSLPDFFARISAKVR
jgi:uncharacterized protein